MRLLIVATVLLAGSSPAFAHHLLSKATLVGDRLRVEAYYDDDTPAQEARVTVRVDARVVVEGRTDEKGVWTCPRPEPGTYTVRVVSVGHAAEPTTLVVNEREPTPPADPAPDDRARRTHTPWGRLAAGLAVIGGLWVAWLISRRAVAKADRAA
jgi:hypothetical protein